MDAVTQRRNTSQEVETRREDCTERQRLGILEERGVARVGPVLHTTDKPLGLDPRERLKPHPFRIRRFTKVAGALCPPVALTMQYASINYNGSKILCAERWQNPRISAIVHGAIKNNAWRAWLLMKRWI